MIRHCVFFSFKTGARQAEIDEIVAAFRALSVSIPQILDFEWGLNSSPEGKDRGLSYCFSLCFASKMERDDYLVHPAHQAFGLLAGPLVKEVLVLDYEIRREQREYQRK
jgi:hypothetical protein